MTFDPYHKWLGIAPKDQPPNHYRLLAIDLFEADPEVIDAAANRQMAYLQQRAHGKHAALSQKLLNEIAAARVCLLNPKKKAKYDAELRAKQAETEQAERSLHPDLSELEASPALNVQGMASVLTPVRPVRARRSFRPEPWHYAVAIGLVSLLGIGGWAVFTSGGKAKQQVAVTEPERPAVPEQKEAAAPPPQAGEPKPSGDKEKTNPTAAEAKPSESPSSTSEQKSNRWIPPVYRLTIEPSWATLDVLYDKATVTGSGRERQVRVDESPGGGNLNLLLVVRCDGYDQKQEWLTPESGKDRELTFSLDESKEMSGGKGKLAEDRLPSGAVLIMTFEPDSLYDHKGHSYVSNLSGERHVGKLYGAKTTEGKVGRGLAFAKGTNLVSRGDFPMGRQPRSLSLWLRSAVPTPQNYAHPVVQGDNGKNQPFGIMIAGGKWRFYDNNGGLGTGVPVDTMWHHHCVVYDGNLLAYYIDHHNIASSSKSLNTASGPLFLGGCFGSGSPFDGEIDELAFFGRALSPEEVGRLYEMGVNGRCLSDRRGSHGVAE